ncbi:ycf2-A Protein [Nymphaea thermarum]|nr:ycf2-A Protein [Nymphaea thermarum]
MAYSEAIWWDTHEQNAAKKHELGFEEREEEGTLNQQQIEEDENLFNHNVWAPKLWHPHGNLFDSIERPNKLGFPYLVMSFRDKQIIYHKEDKVQENDSEFMQSRIV